MKLHLPVSLRRAVMKVLTALALPFATTVASGQWTLPNEETGLGNTMFVGDSITHGVNGDMSWRWQMHKIFVDNGIKYKEVGVVTGNDPKTTPALNVDVAYGNSIWRNVHSSYASVRSYEVSGDNPNHFGGTSIQHWLGTEGDKTPDKEEFRLDASDKPVDTFFMLLGTNDTLSQIGKGNKDPEAAFKGYVDAMLGEDNNGGYFTTIRDAMTGHNPNANMVVLTIPTWNTRDSWVNEYGQKAPAAILEANKRIREWAEKNNATVVQPDIGLLDVTQAEGNGVPSLFIGGNDNLHPNAQGDLIFAGNVAKQLGLAGRTAGQVRKAGTDFTLRKTEQFVNDAGEKGQNVTTEDGKLHFTAGTGNYTYNWDSSPAGGYTVEFTLGSGIGDGASGGWNTTDYFSVSLGNGTLGGTLNIDEAYIRWGNNILYSLDTSTGNLGDGSWDPIRIAYVKGNELQGLLTGFYVWLGDQLIGEGLSPFGSATNGLSITNSTADTVTLSGLYMDDNSWAPEAAGYVNGNPTIEAKEKTPVQDSFTGVTYESVYDNNGLSAAKDGTKITKDEEITVPSNSGELGLLTFEEESKSKINVKLNGTASSTSEFELGTTKFDGIASLYLSGAGLFIEAGNFSEGGPTTIYINGAQLYFSCWQGIQDDVTNMTSDFVIGKGGSGNNGMTGPLAFSKKVVTSGGLTLEEDSSIGFYDGSGEASMTFGGVVAGSGKNLELVAANAKAAEDGGLILKSGGTLGSISSSGGGIAHLFLKLTEGGTLTLEKGGKFGGKLIGDGKAGLAVNSGRLSIGTMEGEFSTLTLGGGATLDITQGSLVLDGALSFANGSRIKLNANGQQITLNTAPAQAAALSRETTSPLTIELSQDFMGDAESGSITLFTKWEEGWNELFTVEVEFGQKTYEGLHIEDGKLVWTSVDVSDGVVNSFTRLSYTTVDQPVTAEGDSTKNLTGNQKFTVEMASYAACQFQYSAEATDGNLWLDFNNNTAMGLGENKIGAKTLLLTCTNGSNSIKGTVELWFENPLKDMEGLYIDGDYVRLHVNRAASYENLDLHLNTPTWTSVSENDCYSIRVASGITFATGGTLYAGKIAGSGYEDGARIELQGGTLTVGQVEGANLKVWGKGTATGTLNLTNGGTLSGTFAVQDALNLSIGGTLQVNTISGDTLTTLTLGANAGVDFQTGTLKATSLTLGGDALIKLKAASADGAQLDFGGITFDDHKLIIQVDDWDDVKTTGYQLFVEGSFATVWSAIQAQGWDKYFVFQDGSGQALNNVQLTERGKLELVASTDLYWPGTSGDQATLTWGAGGDTEWSTGAETAGSGKWVESANVYLGATGGANVMLTASEITAGSITFTAINKSEKGYTFSSGTGEGSTNLVVEGDITNTDGSSVGVKATFDNTVTVHVKGNFISKGTDGEEQEMGDFTFNKKLTVDGLLQFWGGSLQLDEGGDVGTLDASWNGGTIKLGGDLKVGEWFFEGNTNGGHKVSFTRTMQAQQKDTEVFIEVDKVTNPGSPWTPDSDSSETELRYSGGGGSLNFGAGVGIKKSSSGTLTFGAGNTFVVGGSFAAVNGGNMVFDVDATAGMNVEVGENSTITINDRKTLTTSGLTGWQGDKGMTYGTVAGDGTLKLTAQTGEFYGNFSANLDYVGGTTGSFSLQNFTGKKLTVTSGELTLGTAEGATLSSLALGAGETLGKLTVSSGSFTLNGELSWVTGSVLTLGAAEQTITLGADASIFGGGAEREPLTINLTAAFMKGEATGKGSVKLFEGSVSKDWIDNLTFTVDGTTSSDSYYKNLKLRSDGYLSWGDVTDLYWPGTSEDKTTLTWGAGGDTEWSTSAGKPGSEKWVESANVHLGATGGANVMLTDSEITAGKMSFTANNATDGYTFSSQADGNSTTLTVAGITNTAGSTSVGVKATFGEGVNVCVTGGFTNHSARSEYIFKEKLVVDGQLSLWGSANNLSGASVMTLEKGAEIRDLEASWGAKFVLGADLIVKKWTFEGARGGGHYTWFEKLQRTDGPAIGNVYVDVQTEASLTMKGNGGSLLSFGEGVGVKSSGEGNILTLTDNSDFPQNFFVGGSFAAVNKGHMVFDVDATAGMNIEVGENSTITINDRKTLTTSGLTGWQGDKNMTYGAIDGAGTLMVSTTSTDAQTFGGTISCNLEYNGTGVGGADGAMGSSLTLTHAFEGKSLKVSAGTLKLTGGLSASGVEVNLAGGALTVAGGKMTSLMGGETSGGNLTITGALEVTTVSDKLGTLTLSSGQLTLKGGTLDVAGLTAGGGSLAISLTGSGVKFAEGMASLELQGAIDVYLSYEDVKSYITDGYQLFVGSSVNTDSIADHFNFIVDGEGSDYMVTLKDGKLVFTEKHDPLRWNGSGDLTWKGAGAQIEDDWDHDGTFGPHQDVTFLGTATSDVTVSLDGAIEVDNMVVGETGENVTGYVFRADNGVKLTVDGTLTLNDATTFEVTTEVKGKLEGAGDLTVKGDMTLGTALDGKAFTGGITLSGGTLQLAAGGTVSQKIKTSGGSSSTIELGGDLKGDMMIGGAWTTEASSTCLTIKNTSGGEVTLELTGGDPDAGAEADKGMYWGNLTLGEDGKRINLKITGESNKAQSFGGGGKVDIYGDVELANSGILRFTRAKDSVIHGTVNGDGTLRLINLTDLTIEGRGGIAGSVDNLTYEQGEHVNPTLSIGGDLSFKTATSLQGGTLTLNHADVSGAPDTVYLLWNSTGHTDPLDWTTYTGKYTGVTFNDNTGYGIAGDLTISGGATIGENLKVAAGTMTFKGAATLSKAIEIGNGTTLNFDGGVTGSLTKLTLGASSTVHVGGEIGQTLDITSGLTWGRGAKLDIDSQLTINLTGATLTKPTDGSLLTIDLSSKILDDLGSGVWQLFSGWESVATDWTQYFKFTIDGKEVDSSEYGNLGLDEEGKLTWVEPVHSDLYWQATEDDTTLTWGGKNEWSSSSSGGKPETWPGDESTSAGVDVHVAGEEGEKYNVEMTEDVTARSAEFNGGDYTFDEGESKLTTSRDLTVGTDKETTVDFGNKQLNVGGKLTLGSGSSVTTDGKLDVAGDVNVGSGSLTANGGGTWGSAQVAPGGILTMKDTTVNGGVKMGNGSRVNMEDSTVKGELSVEGGKLTVGGNSTLGSMSGKLTGLEIADGGNLTANGNSLEADTFTWGKGSTLGIGSGFSGTLNFDSMAGEGNLTLDFSSQFLDRLGTDKDSVSLFEHWDESWRDKLDFTIDGKKPEDFRGGYYGNLSIGEDGTLTWTRTGNKPYYESSTDNGTAKDGSKTEWATNPGENIYDSVGDWGSIVVDSNTNIDLTDAEKKDAKGNWNEDGLTVHNLNGGNLNAKLTIIGDGADNNKVTLKNKYNSKPEDGEAKYSDDLTYSGGLTVEKAELRVNHEDTSSGSLHQGAELGTVMKGELDLSDGLGLYMDRGVLELQNVKNELTDVTFTHGRDGQLIVNGGAATVSGNITVVAEGEAVYTEDKEGDPVTRNHVQLVGGGVLQLVGGDMEEKATTVGAGVTIGAGMGFLSVGGVVEVKGNVKMEKGSKLNNVLLMLDGEGTVLEVGAPPAATAHSLAVEGDAVPTADGGGDAEETSGTLCGLIMNGGKITGNEDYEFQLNGGNFSTNGGDLSEYRGTMTFGGFGWCRQVFTRMKGSKAWNMTMGNGAQVLFDVVGESGTNAGWEMGDVNMQSGSHTIFGFTFNGLSPTAGMKFHSFTLAEDADITFQAYGGSMPTNRRFIIGSYDDTADLNASSTSAAEASADEVEETGELKTRAATSGSDPYSRKLERSQLVGGAWLHVKEATLKVEGRNILMELEVADTNLLAEAVQGTHQNATEGAKALWELTGFNNPKAVEALRDLNSDTNKLTNDAYSLWSSGKKDELAKLLSAASGAAYTGYSAAFGEDMHRQLTVIRNRTTSMGEEAAQAATEDGMPYWHTWVNAESSFRELDADGLAPGYRLNGWGGTLGVDADISRVTTVGLALTAMYNDLKCTGADSISGDMDTMYATAFVRHMSGRWMHTFVISEGSADFKTHRTVMTGNGSYTANADTDGYALGALYELGYATLLEKDARSVIQYVLNAEVRYNNISGFTESGSDAGLSVEDMDSTTLTFGAGARFQSLVGENVYNRSGFFEARFLVKVDAGDRRGEAATRFINGSYVTDMVGAEVGVVGVEIGAGINIPLGGGLSGGSFFIDGSFEFRQGWTSFDATAGFRISF